MKFLKLKLDNFMTLGTGISIELADRGLNVIQGENIDNPSATSNGAGKSTIVDGLSYVLYGVTARGYKGDKVVNNKVGKNTVACVTMKNDDTAYRITRHRKHSVHKNQLHIEAFSLAVVMTPDAIGLRLDKGTEAESQKELEKILGCSYEVFKSAVYAGQEEMPDLPRMGDRELKSLIEEAAGMQRIERAYQISRTRMGEAKTSLATSTSTLDSFKVQLATAIDAAEFRTKDHSEWEDDRVTRVMESGTALLGFTGVELLSKEKLDASALTLPVITAGITKLSAVIASSTAARKTADAALKEKDRLEGLVSHRNFIIMTAAVKSVEKKVADAPAHMDKSCTECGKPHTRAELKDYLDIQLAAGAVAERNLKLAHEQITKELALVTAQAAVHKVLVDAIPDVSEVARKLALLNEAKAKHAALVASHKLAVIAVTAAQSQLVLRETQPNPFAAAVADLLERRTDLEIHCHLSTVTLGLKTKAFATAEAVVKVFGPSGVRAQILDTVTPYLNARTADYLSMLTDGVTSATWTTLTKSAAGELKEKFSIDVTDTQGAEDFQGLSGGEKRKVRLATALALQDLVASRATQPIELFIADEIDQALDPAGMERLMVLLERKARERGTVLVISHNSLSDWCDSVTTVRKEGGVSTVSGSLVE